jgi:hypothetical protein
MIYIIIADVIDLHAFIGMGGVWGNRALRSALCPGSGPKAGFHGWDPGVVQTG